MNVFYKKTVMCVLSGAAVLALSACGGSNGTPTEVGAGEIESPQLPLAPTEPAAYVPVYPTEPDAFEGSTGDNNASTAGTIEVGAPLQARSIYPQGDYDWVKVELEEGVVYDIFAYNLNEVGDTYLYLYNDTDQSQGNHIDEDDDYIDFDSYIEFNATYTGTYYIKVRSFSVREATSYQLGIRLHVDADDDGYSEVYDCNDNNDTIYPYAPEIAGDGIDQDCSGVDAIADGVADSYEADNNIASAKPIPETQGSYEEYIHRYDIYSKMHTIHNDSDTDFFRIVMPPYSGAYGFEWRYSGGLNNYDWYTYDENGTEVRNGSGGIDEDINNDTDTEQTYYLEVRGNGINIGWYVPALVRIGEDKDGDGYYTQDWSGDCNDNNASINPDASDSLGDGIDQNCDGVDGDNSDYDND